MESCGFWMFPPIPYAAHVDGRNCIGPCAPAPLAERVRPNFDSTNITDASTSHRTPNRRCASRNERNRTPAGSGLPVRNLVVGRIGPVIDERAAPARVFAFACPATDRGRRAMALRARPGLATITP